MATYYPSSITIPNVVTSAKKVCVKKGNVLYPVLCQSQTVKITFQWTHEYSTYYHYYTIFVKLEWVGGSVKDRFDIELNWFFGDVQSGANYKTVTLKASNTSVTSPSYTFDTGFDTGYYGKCQAKEIYWHHSGVGNFRASGGSSVVNLGESSGTKTQTITLAKLSKVKLVI